MSIRWKIAILCILLALIPVVVLNHYTVDVFDGFTRRMQEEQMISQARVVADDMLRDRPGSGDADFGERLRQYERRFGTRLQVIGPDGTLLLDSSPDASLGSDASPDREIARALDGRYGARSQLTPDRSLMYYYIALPAMADDDLIGVVRAIAHTREITRAIVGIARDFRRAMAIAVGVAAMAAILLSMTLTYRLRVLTRAARRFARGNSRLMPEPRGRDEIAELGRAFGELAREITRNNERQGNLLASTIHELKTPLTAIKGAVQMLRDEGAMDDLAARARFLGNIDISSDRLLRMVEQLAALSKLRAEELRGRKEPVAYGAFVTEVVNRLYPSPPVRLELDLPGQDVTVMLIPERIERVLANLLDNAFRHTPPDGRVTVAVRVADGSVETAVRDTGCGIEPSDLAQVFDHFFTTVPRNSLRESGMGLGLSIALAIAQNHGGTIRAESQPGEGSVFTFTLPA